MVPQATPQQLVQERDRLRLLLDVNLDAPAPGGVLAEGALLPLEGTPPGTAIATRKTVLRDRIDLEEFHSPIMR